MQAEAAVAVLPPARAAPQSGRIVAARVAILLVVLGWAFRPEVRGFFKTWTTASDWAHGLVLPLAIFLLVLRRWAALAAAVRRGSIWGIVLLLAALLVYGLCYWPFTFAYPRELALTVAAAGVILATCGWRVLKLCVPMLLLLLLSTPIGSRMYASLIIRPETATLALTHRTLDALPSVDVTLTGPDLDFRRGGARGTVALGESRRGAALLITYVFIGVFVAFARIRPAWQIVALAVAAVPVALFCNLLRLIGRGLITIYVEPDPLASWPRSVAAAGSLLLAYLLFAGGARFLSGLVQPAGAAEDTDDALEPEQAGAEGVADG
ncbi:MAG: archaeosortase/exosortase family protein [Planctomycetota bacterium]